MAQAAESRAEAEQRQVGLRLRAAREAKGWNQEQVAGVLELNDRQSISDIETGRRALRPDELVLLADALGHDVDFFLEPFSVVGEAGFSWRTAEGLSATALERFEAEAGRWIGMARWLWSREHADPSPLRQSLRVGSQTSFELVQGQAEQLGRTLELGAVPAEPLADRIETRLKIPVFFVDIDTSRFGDAISGAMCNLEDLRVILVNRNETEGRRNYDLAHELFHALTWDALPPSHRESNATTLGNRGRRAEQLANNFAAALLMPRAVLEASVDRTQSQEPDVRRLVELAARLRVTSAALAWRLFNLEWINAQTRVRLADERQVTSDTPRPKRYSSWFVGSLHRAIDAGTLSPRKAAKALAISLEQLGDLCQEHGFTPAFDQ